MRVQELLMNVDNKELDVTKMLEIKRYVPIMQKKMFVSDVIAECTDDVDGFICADKFKMNIYFNMKVIGLYTNIEIAEDFDGMVEQYDILCENDILNYILALFADEYNIMCNVLDNILNELLVQNSIDVQVVKVANKIMNILNSFDSIDIESILSNVNVSELFNNVNI